MKKISQIVVFLMAMLFPLQIAFAEPVEEVSMPEAERMVYLKAVISTGEAVEIDKSNIFDASQSFIPDTNRKVRYSWDFGDGNFDEGLEVLHSYSKPGKYTVKLTIDDGVDSSVVEKEVFAYRKLILLLTDNVDVEKRLGVIKNYSEEQGVFIKILDSFGSSTEFISEEILAKKLTEEKENLQKAQQIVIWTKENAGLNALSRFIQANSQKETINFTQKTLAVLEEDISASKNRIQRQFKVINPHQIILIKEAALYPLIDSQEGSDFLATLKKGGYEYTLIDSGKISLRPWNFMSYFVNLLINKGVPDNTIALLLLLPVIATVVVIMKQVVGVTTFGIYTPTIITLSFLIIGLPAGFLTLFMAIVVGIAFSQLLKRTRILFIPKMAILLTIVSLFLFLIIILSTYWGLFNAEFLSLAIFPMLILSTLVEKFISVKTEKGFSSATLLMLETLIVAIVAYFVAGGELNLGFGTIHFEFVRRVIIAHPEIVLFLLAINLLLGHWTGLRILELIRFREILRHIEE